MTRARTPPGVSKSAKFNSKYALRFEDCLSPSIRPTHLRNVLHEDRLDALPLPLELSHECVRLPLRCLLRCGPVGELGGAALLLHEDELRLEAILQRALVVVEDEAASLLELAGLLRGGRGRI